LRKNFGHGDQRDSQRVKDRIRQDKSATATNLNKTLNVLQFF